MRDETESNITGASDGVLPPVSAPSGRRRRRSRKGAADAVTVAVEQAGLISTAESLAQVTAPAPETINRDDLLREVDRMSAGVRTLLALARSAALPPAGRVDEVEQTLARQLESLRAAAAGNG